jgi:hypothetical protein
MISAGLYKYDRSYQLINLSRKRIACFDGELLRELSWNIFLHSEDEGNCENLSTMISMSLLRHEACLHSLTKDDCAFYHDPKGPFARNWTENQFRTVHEEFRTLTAILAGIDGKEVVEKLNDDELYEITRPFFSKSISQKLLSPSYSRVTMQYSGQSQIAGTKMMHFVEDRILDLISCKFRKRQMIVSMPDTSQWLLTILICLQNITRTNMK